MLPLAAAEFQSNLRTSDDFAYKVHFRGLFNKLRCVLSRSAFDIVVFQFFSSAVCQKDDFPRKNIFYGDLGGPKNGTVPECADRFEKECFFEGWKFPESLLSHAPTFRGVSGKSYSGHFGAV